MEEVDERDRSLLKAIGRKKVTESDAAKLQSDVTPEYLQALVDRGLLVRTTRGKKREPAYELTAIAKEALKPLPKPRPARAKKSPPVTLDDLRAMEARLLEQLDALGRELAASRPAPPAETQPTPRPAKPAVPRDPDGYLRSAIPTAIRDADLAGRFGGMVPIPEVRKVVQSRTGASRTEFDDVLLALEREFLVDLKIANDPRRPDASEGIAVPGRGLVFFALAR
ncbi:MAG: hypothetical protein ACJ79W_18180 [Myxococcales bacterium]